MERSELAWLCALRLSACVSLAYEAYLSTTHLHFTETGTCLVSFDQLLAESDFLTVHLPLNEKTRGMLNLKIFEKMKPTAFLINTSRGEIIVEEDLVKALQEGKLAGAALDVREIGTPTG